MKLTSEATGARADSRHKKFRRRDAFLDLSRFLTTELHRIHLVGVAGSGMSGLAGLLIELGHAVSGSDKVTTTETERLQRLGLRFHEQHVAEHADAADLVVFSSAIKDDNPILLAARSCGKPLFRRAEAVAAIMQAKRGIVIAGMHGKTTTSAMTAHVLREGGLHPSHYVGAEIPILGTNAYWNPRGEYFVAEGDESDGTLCCFHPEHALILNIEEEHLDFYPDLAAIERVFAQLIDQTSGSVLYNIDDPNTARLCGKRERAVSYGFSEQADYRGADVELQNFGSSFLVCHRGTKLGQATLNVPGEHNVHNALGVIALASELSIPFDKITASLRKFEHARRRFEIKYASDRFLLVDDYAHHPTEIRATLRAAKSIGRRRLVTMFQPHRFSRTKALFREFGSAFDDADRVVITDIYPASEPPIPGITGRTIADEIVRHGHRGVSYQPRLQSVHRDVGNMLEAGDLVLSLGAGNIHEQLEILAADLVIAEKLKAIVGEEGEVRLYEPMSNHTTLRVGGPAQFWVEPRTEQTFAELIRFCRDEYLPLFAIGRGSNLLVRDGGIRGVVVHPHGGDFEKIEADECEITAGAGVKLRQVAYAARAENVGGLEWMEGIPGTVGGGLRMNAGAMGAQTFENVSRIRYLDADGNSHVKNRDELEVFYRRFPLLEKNFAISATFRGQPAERAEIDTRLRESQEKRRTTQPVAKSAGCIFKNPATIPAGKLVDELGLKNSRVGNARVSRVHGNFIVNDGDATASEVLELIDDIKSVARKKRGIELETEVEIVGEPEMTKREELPKKIAVLMGGPGSEREVSLATGRGVAKALRSLGPEVVEIDVRDENFQLPGEVDLTFITIHGTFGEDGQIQKILERRGIAYTGDGVSASEIAFDKIRTKQKFQEHGVTTPPWEVIHPGQQPTIPLPIVVKTPRQGSTVGVVIVKNENELESAIGEAAKYGRELLIEKFVSGRELTIGILGDQALPILEIIPKGGFYDFNNKYPFLNPQAGGGAEHVCPANIDAEKTKEIQELALRAFRSAGLQVYARVDAILSDNGQPYILEINTIPGMTEASLLPEAAAAAGIDYADLCARIIALSRLRQGYGEQARARTEGKR